MALLADNLARIDATGTPAYLESTNPANLDRYRSVGFVDRDTFRLPAGEPEVTTMWREPVAPRTADAPPVAGTRADPSSAVRGP